MPRVFGFSFRLTRRRESARVAPLSRIFFGQIGHRQVFATPVSQSRGHRRIPARFGRTQIRVGLLADQFRFHVGPSGRPALFKPPSRRCGSAKKINAGTQPPVERIR